MALETFHPAVSAWFARRFGAPTEPQRLAWPAIARGRHVLIAAPTGSGKTLAAFLAVIDELLRDGLVHGLPDETRVIYVSPLKALSNDIQRNLQEPLSGIREELAARGLPDVEIRTMVRTGDTPAAERSAMTRRPPHVLVTTPESLYILLTSAGGRRIMSTARRVIVDEIHAVVADKRGAHLGLSLERLAALVGEQGATLQRIGLSATQRPIADVGRFLVGSAGIDAGGAPDCELVDVGHRRAMDLAIEVPPSPLEAVMSGEVWGEVYDRLADHVRRHATTLVFVNTRRLAERVTRHLGERLGEERITSHHGSLSREQRLTAEQRLKNGQLQALVATSSLELGIDIGSVDLVCEIGSTRSIARLLQRVGRSGHSLGALPKGRVFPTSRDELVECAALVDAIHRGDLERLSIPDQPLDILAQQIVAEVAAREWAEDELFALVRRAWSYRNLTRAEFDEVVEMLARGFSTRVGRRAAYVHHDAVNGRLRGRRGARLVAITSGGAIPDTADYRVILEPDGTFIGTLNEDFAIESMAGDIFQLGNASWRIRRIEQGRVLVEDARGESPTIPFWLGEAPARSDELCTAVSRLRETVADQLDGPPGSAERWLAEHAGTDVAAAEQIVEYLAAGRAALGALPSATTLVLERFFDEAGNQHLVLHSPFGGRVNRAWGLALRKRFCRSFNFELQAAATEDAIVLSLGPTHSFPAEAVFSFLHSSSVREVLIQALLDAPMFAIRWRWNAGRALAVPRFRSGRKVAAPLLRMQAEDLLSLVFPDQLACAENLVGEREIPDHPLVRQTVRDCLVEAMDIERLEAILRELEQGRVRTIVRELAEPSPLAHEALNARPYAFLDDAPLEERRTQAVLARRWIDPADAADLGRLDPSAIDAVREEVWPRATHADELHDGLLELGFVTAAEGAAAAPLGWQSLFDELVAAGRARLLVPATGAALWVAAERLPELCAMLPASRVEPPITLPPRLAERQPSPDHALVEVVRSRLGGLGPVTVEALAGAAGIDAAAVEGALAALEAEGFAMRGRFTPELGTGTTEWCERRLLARIHRRTLDRLRREIQPVAKPDFVRFLLSWQRVAPEERLQGPEGLLAVLEQLEGFVAPAAAWEGDILPARLAQYDPIWLDALCLSGRFVWMRAGRGAAAEVPRSGPVRLTPICLLRREHVQGWNACMPGRGAEVGVLSAPAREVVAYLRDHGASFFEQIVQGSGLLRTQVEEALGELVSCGLATSDSFAGLRALLAPSSRRPALAGGPRRATALFGMEGAGRWALLTGNGEASVAVPPPAAGTAELVADLLLRRYGVVFRALLDRETLHPSWRELLAVYRRLEARGELRGGRFVDGVGGEQFALPDAIGRLRKVRREGATGQDVSVSAADPLNLVGPLLAGDRVPVHPANRILYRNGLPLAVCEAGEVRFLDELGPTDQWQARTTLLRRRVPPLLRAYLGRPA